MQVPLWSCSLFVLMLLDLDEESGSPVATEAHNLRRSFARGLTILSAVPRSKTRSSRQSFRENHSQIGLVKELGNLLFSKIL